MDYDSLKDNTQSGLRTGAVIIMNKSIDIVAVIAHFARVIPPLLSFGPTQLTLYAFHSSTNTNHAVSAHRVGRAQLG